MQRITLIGYGEVGKIFATNLQSLGLNLSAWDLKFNDPATRNQARAHAAQQHITAGDDATSACANAQLIISAVTASNTLAVAQEAAAEAARAAGLGVNAGHDLTVENIPALIKRAPFIREMSIGHGFTADALIHGFAESVRRFRRSMGEI